METHYEVLGVTHSATVADVHAAYNSIPQTPATDLAFSVLSDPGSRLEYDQSLPSPTPLTQLPQRSAQKVPIVPEPLSRPSRPINPNSVADFVRGSRQVHVVSPVNKVVITVPEPSPQEPVEIHVEESTPVTFTPSFESQASLATSQSSTKSSSPYVDRVKTLLPESLPVERYSPRRVTDKELEYGLYGVLGLSMLSLTTALLSYVINIDTLVVSGLMGAMTLVSAIVYAVTKKKNPLDDTIPTRYVRPVTGYTDSAITDEVEAFTAIPGARVFHDVSIEEGQFMHAVVYDHNVAFIECVYGPGGKYEWSDQGVKVSDVEIPLPTMKKFTEARKRLLGLSKGYALSRYFVVVLPHYGVEVDTSDTATGKSYAYVVSREELFKSVTEWFMRDADSVVNMRVIDNLLP